MRACAPSSTRPRAYGWPADLAIHSGGGYDFFDVEGGDQAAAAEGVDGLTVAGFASLSLDEHEVNAIGIVPIEGPALVSVVDGSVPTEVNQIALGTNTARDLHVGIGDDVDAGQGSLRVVGLVALPAIGPVASAHPSLGQGALMTMEGLSRLNDNAYPSLALLRLADGLDPTEEAPRLIDAVAEAMSENPPDFASSYVDLRPSEVVGLGSASRTTYLLAAVLGGAAALALVLTLSASVRRRRRTYLVLSAVGLDRGDLRQTVRWQLNLVMGVAMAVGLAVGIAIGRVAWIAFADQLGAMGDPRVPVPLLAGAVVGLVALTNVIGEWPARAAARRSTDVTLRDL